MYESDDQKQQKTKKKKKPKIKITSIFKGILLCAVFLVICLAAFASVIGVMMLQEITQELPPIEVMRSYQPSLTSVVYDRKDKIIARLFEENRTWVDIRNISPWFVKAVIAAEDTEFYEHQGIRVKAIIRAALQDLQAGRAKSGGSTITQQLARMLFLSRERSIQRKAAEAIIAIRMEKIYTKDQILEMYLNMAYFGHGAYGIGAASQVYYGKPAAQLNLAEASMLAGILPAPNNYTPIRHLDRAKVRQNYTLSRMVEANMITEQEKDQAYGAELAYARGAESKVTFVMEDAPHFVSHILFKDLLPKYGRDKIYRGGLRIHTTIDLELQKHAEEVMSKLKFEGALVALDPNTGEILAMVGGRDFEKSKFNRATQAFRQPGSSFKAIVYATAFEQGYRPVDHMLDAPLVFPNGWSPKNSDLKNRGEMILAEALPLSINTIAVRLTQVAGVRSVMDQARKMGITTPYLPENLSIALGSSSLTPLEMGAAFCVFANNGYRVDPFGIKQIVDSHGRPVEQNGPSITNALSPETAVTVRSLLIQAVNWGTGTRAKIPDYQVFGKTGTTNDFTDVWFIGGTPDLVTVVYIGNDNHKTLGRAFGGTVAAPVWQEFMAKAVKIMNTPKQFSIPSGVGVQAVTICRQTGFIAGKDCAKKANIMMAVGQAPESRCPWHGGDVTIARNDVHAPQLILTLEDEGLRGQYAMTPAWQDEQVYNDNSEIFAPHVADSQSYSPPPPDAVVNTPQYDPAVESEIDRRFQELLEQYNIQ